MAGTASITASVGARGMNHPSDVITVQTLLNEHLSPQFPVGLLRVDGNAGPKTVAAIREFQRCIMRLPQSDGRVDPGGPTLQALLLSRRAEPAWMQIARREIGVKAVRGYEKNSPRILRYIATFPYLKDVWADSAHTVHMSQVDETPWCACFVNWCLIQAGKSRGPSAAAADWVRYGDDLDQPRPGAIAVVYHTPSKNTSGTTSSGNHVAFYAGGTGACMILLGGNQSHAVSEKTFGSSWIVKGYRWPR